MCTSRVKDPRFEELSGKLDPDRFREQYGFVYDEIIPAETAQLKASMQVGHTAAGLLHIRVHTAVS